MDTDQILNIALGTVVGLVAASAVTYALSLVIPAVSAGTDTAETATTKALVSFFDSDQTRTA